MGHGRLAQSRPGAPLMHFNHIYLSPLFCRRGELVRVIDQATLVNDVSAWSWGHGMMVKSGQIAFHLSVFFS